MPPSGLRLGHSAAQIPHKNPSATPRVRVPGVHPDTLQCRGREGLLVGAYALDAADTLTGRSRPLHLPNPLPAPVLCRPPVVKLSIWGTDLMDSFTGNTPPRPASDPRLRSHQIPRLAAWKRNSSDRRGVGAIGSNAISAIMGSAGRVVAASPALSANTCMTRLEIHLVTCSFSGRLGGSLSRIVTTQVTRPGKQGTPGDWFSQLAGNADIPWEVGDASGWTGGQVVAGSNPVSPTKFRQVKCYFYLLPKPARPVHLIRCQRRPAIAASLPGAKPALTCVFCPKVRRPDGREEFSASCDTHVGRRRPPIPFTPRNKLLNRAFPSRGGPTGDDWRGVWLSPTCHIWASDSTTGAISASRSGLLCRASPGGHRDDVIAYQRGALGRRVR
jgi:hypothetical protein